jgi:hypothetical protein
MGSLRKILDRLFKTQKEEYTVPFLHEKYSFDTDTESYILWKGGRSHLALSQKIDSSFNDYLSKKDPDAGTTIIHNGKVSGIALDAASYGFKKTDYIHYCSYLIDRLTQNGYILHLSEIKSKKTAGTVMQSIKAYLKPSRKRVIENKNEQIYGNITLDISSKADRLFRFKISCSYYQDQHFHDPLDFKTFVEDIILV